MKIGDVIRLKEHTVVENPIGEGLMMMPKGTVFIIGADGLAHHSFATTEIEEEVEKDNYNSLGIASYIVARLEDTTFIENFYGDIGTTRKDFIENIESALEGLGFVGRNSV